MMADRKGVAAGAGMLAILGLALAGCQSARPPAPVKGPLIVSASPCADFTQTLYFEEGSAAITRPAERLLTLAAARSRGCLVTGVAVVGLADSPGDPASNLALSQRRADAVKAALHGHGFDQVEIQTTAVGNAGALTAGGQDKPVHRRANITFHLAPAAPK
jgi:outer membrane protein OmpA-like peptidoglycan-associated protein